MAPPALRLDAAIRVEGLVADPDRIFVFLGSRQHIPPHETGKGHIAAEEPFVSKFTRKQGFSSRRCWWF